MNPIQTLRKAPAYVPILAFILVSSLPSFAQPVPKNAQFAERPGRLTGWGIVDKEEPLQLPQGVEAEGFIAVAGGHDRWIALKADGTVRTGGNLTKTDWASRQPEHLDGLKVIDVAAGPGLYLLYDDGTVQSHAARVDARPAETLRDIVSISASGGLAAALRKDGRAFAWGGVMTNSSNPNFDPELQKKVGELLESEVAFIKAGVDWLFVAKTDGSRHLFRFPHHEDHSATVASSSFPLDTLTLTRGHGFYQNADGTWGGWEVDEKKPDLPIPSFSEPIVELRADQTRNLARLKSGAWQVWGDSKLDILPDPARLNRLLAFDLNHYEGPAHKVGNVLGIEPSYADGFLAGAPADPPSALSDLLSELDTAREALRTKLDQWDVRYLEELAKLEAKATTPSAQSEIRKEKAEFRNLNRPFSPLEPVARFQKIYREKATQYQAEIREATQSLYAQAEAQVQKLAASHSDAEVIRQEAAKIAAAKVYLSNQKESLEVAPQVVPAVPTPDSNQKFRFDDEYLRGDLVAIGYLGGERIERPRRLKEKSDVVRVAAGFDNWMAIYADGTSLSVGNSMLAKTFPADAPRLKSAFVRGVLVGFDLRNRPIVFGKLGGPNWKDFQFPAGINSLVAFELTPDNAHAVAVAEDGTVFGWGRKYALKPIPWVPLPDDLRAIDCAVTMDLRAFIKQDGSLVVWEDDKERNLPVAIKSARFLKIESSGRQILGLTDKGQVHVIGRPDEWAQPPEGLSNVVDIAAGYGLLLALQANGEWVGWGRNEDNILRDLPKLSGVRRIAVGGPIGPGGTGTARFIVGIRYPEKE